MENNFQVESGNIEKEIINFILEKDLKPFGKSSVLNKSNGKSIFKTRDAKIVSNKSLNVVSRNFIFSDTSQILKFFDFPSNKDEVLQRQEFFKSFKKYDNSFLKNLEVPRPFWNPDYGIIVVTENEDTFKVLNEIGCDNVKFIVNESDVLDLEKYDVVQVIDCENFSGVLERLPQSIFLNSVDEAYLERYVRVFSGWKNNLEILAKADLPKRMKILVDELHSLSYLTESPEKNKISKEIIEVKLNDIKCEISERVKELQIKGDLLLEVLNEGKLPKELDEVVREAIGNSGLPEELFTREIPVKIDEKEMETLLRDQDLNKFANIAEEIKRKSNILVKIPEKLRSLELELLFFDFQTAIANWNEEKFFPEISREFVLGEIYNEFLERPQPVSFHLNDEHRCSILTGANSGGKTTLLENIIQIITYSYLGLPMRGKVKIPLFNEIYYFAKNKGSASKGAFETMLTQMSEINPGKDTLILADEIEAVTEPGVAGRMIGASIQYFVEKECFLVFATHLGQEIEKNIPMLSRIDGIEAKGLDENNELIVDHNPVIGKLASSTPELIVEKMAKTSEKTYFKFLHEYLNKEKI